MPKNADSPPKSKQNTTDQIKAVTECAEWFRDDKTAKASWVNAEIEDLDRLYNGSHWDLTGPAGTVLRTESQQKTRPNSVENMTFSLIEGLVSEFSRDVDIVDFPVDPSDEEAALALTDLKKYLAYKNRLVIQRQKFNRNLFLYGTGIWHVYWDPHWVGGKGPNRWVGDVRWTALHPRSFFPDARCGDDLNATARRVHKAVYTTLEHIKEKYPDYGHLATESVEDTETMAVLTEDVTVYASQQEQTLLLETWYIGEPLLLDKGEPDGGVGLHVVWWTGESNPVYLKHANYVNFDPGEEPQFPFIVRQRYPREREGKRSIWGYGDAHFLKSPQITLNKTTELILEGHMHHALGQTYYNVGSVTPTQERRIRNHGTLPGMWFAVQNKDGIKRENGSGVPSSLQSESNRIQRTMETIIGRFDVSQGRTPGSVTAFRAIDLLAERSQVRLRAAETAITTAYEDMGTYSNRLIMRGYTEERSFRILGSNPSEKIRRGVVRVADFNKIHVMESGEVLSAKDFDPGNMVEGEDYEVFSPEFDTICRVSTQMASDRVFFMEAARDMLAAQLIDGETFWYVMENGKFPPYEQMIQKEQERQEMTAQQPPAQPPPATPPPPASEPMAPSPEELIASLPPEMQQQLASMPPEQQMQALDQLAQAMSQG